MNRNLLFTIDGQVTAKNPHAISVTIRKISYKGYIDNEIVFTGELAGQTIPPKGNATFFFSQEINWVPDKDTAIAIMEGNDVVLTVFIEPEAAYLYFFTITGEKELHFNIADYLVPYIREQLASLSSIITGFF